MKNIYTITLLSFFLVGIYINQSFAQGAYEIYTVPQNGSQNILIENGKLYRVTIKSCWSSAYARMGSYLFYGLNIADPKTNGKPEVLKISETESIDWTFSYSQSGEYNSSMTITSTGWGDQGLLIVVESAFSENYTDPQKYNLDILIKNGGLYRVTIRSCWYSADARIGSYLIYGLNIADPKTNGKPEVLKISETESIDWTFSYSQSGDYNANMTITGTGWGNQGLFVFVERMYSPGATAIHESDLILKSDKLAQNYPNPFNPTTTIEYSVQTNSLISLNIYNSNGQLVKTLVNESKIPGEYSVVWNGKDDRDKQVASGVYFYKLYTKNFTSSKKMIILK